LELGNFSLDAATLKGDALTLAARYRITLQEYYNTKARCVTPKAPAFDEERSPLR
jgi:hypothetical protein